MHNLKSKTMAIMIAVILTISMAASTILLPVSAHDPPWNVRTTAFIHAAPNPCGIGQTITVGFWINQPPPTAGGPYGDRYSNMTVKVTHPDETTTILGPFTSDDTGGSYTTYTPTQLGTYTFQHFYGGDTLLNVNPRPGNAGISNARFVNDTMLPSTSAIISVTVQEEPIADPPLAPLPTNWWETPLNAMNVINWYPLAGASLIVRGYSTSSGSLYSTASNFNPYTTAVKTAHILWNKPIAFGGILGGEFGGSTTYGNYYSTQQYEHKFEPIIINGFLYYTHIPGSIRNPVANICLDLKTGETVWINDATNYGGGNPAQTALTSRGLVTPLYNGQILDYVSPNQYGGIAYLWTRGNLDGINSTNNNDMNMFDAMTGKYILSIVNCRTLNQYYDDLGNLIGYYVNNTDHTLVKWNSTQAILRGTTGEDAWQWRPTQNAVIDFSLGVMWRMPLATTYLGEALYGNLAIRNNDGETIVARVYEPGTSSYYQGGSGIFAGYSADTGQQLWIKKYDLTPFDGDVNTGSSTCGNGVFTISLKAAFEISGYSMTTGEKLWTTPLRGYDDATPDAYSTVGGYCSIAAYDSLYYAGFGGDIWSIDMLTGNVNWYTNTTTLQGPSGTLNPYGIWPIWTFSVGGVADGLLFLAEGHEYSPPLFLGAQQLAINTTTGELVWSIKSFNVDSHPVTAYGVMTNLNAYDNQIYAFAKGPSKTTVTAPSVGVTTAIPITIAGTVTDISAGAQQHATATNFPSGLPAVSDNSMTPWMEYVYMQQPRPTDATGVPVSIYVIDSNGNYRPIGTTTSDISGTFALTWTPDIPGDYTVIATFAGSESYYQSNAEAHFTASEPAATPAPTDAPAQSAADMYFVPAIAGLFVFVAVMSVVIILVLRKRP